MEKTTARRVNDSMPLVINDEIYALIKAMEELTKSIEALARK